VVEREHVRDREEALEPACRLPADLLTYLAAMEEMLWI
jgi:hypothetical protein